MGSFRRPITYIEQAVFRPSAGSMPKQYREIVNILIDQGWHFEQGKVGSHHKLVPPDPTKKICRVPSTPSDNYKGFIKWITQLRRNGAEIDENGNSTRVEEKTVVPQVQVEPVAFTDAPDLSPVSTRGAWWRHEPAPAPVVPLPAPVQPARPLRRVIPSRVAPMPDPNAEGDAFSLSQARTLIRQGYHLNRVVAKTGWGRNWFNDLVDETGYYCLDE